MSEQPTDERGIDEILASIDEMLADKTIYSYKPGKKEEISSLLTSASKRPSARQQPKAGKEVEKNAPQKIMLTQSNLAESPSPAKTVDAGSNASPKKTANDPFDLSPEELFSLDDQHAADANAATAEGTDKKVVAAADDAASPTASAVSSVDASDSSGAANDAEPAESENSAADFDAADEIVDEEDEAFDEADDDAADSDASAVTAKHRIVLTEAFLEPSAQEALPLWIEQEEDSPASNAAEAGKAEDGTTEKSATEDKRELPGHVLQASAEPEEEVLHEPIVRNELVEAIVHDALSTRPEELSTAVKHEMASIISKYELNQLAEIITEEVSAELQKQIQENLPKLIQKSLRQHFELLDKDSE